MQKVKDLLDGGENLEAYVAEKITKHLKTKRKFIPEFGHLFHKPEDPWISLWAAHCG